MIGDGFFTGVVGRERKLHVALEVFEQLAEVLHAGIDILVDVEWIGDVEFAGGAGINCISPMAPLLEGRGG